MALVRVTVALQFGKKHLVMRFSIQGRVLLVGQSYENRLPMWLIINQLSATAVGKLPRVLLLAVG
jgi:hypothetical protein